MKRVLLSLITVTFLFLFCSCNKFFLSPVDIVLSELKEKYNEEFYIVDYIPKNIDASFDEFILKNSKGDIFKAYLEKADGEPVITDNYYGVLKQGEYKKTIKNILDNYFSEYKFFTSFNAGYFDNKYDCNYELKYALKDNKHQFFSNSYIFITDESAGYIDESNYEELCHELEKSGYTLYIAIYSVSDKEFLSIDEEKDVNLFLPDDYRVDPVFKKTIR